MANISDSAPRNYGGVHTPGSESGFDPAIGVSDPKLNTWLTACRKASQSRRRGDPARPTIDQMARIIGNWTRCQGRTTISNSELSAAAGTSDVTVRRCIEFLEKHGLLAVARTRGPGAVGFSIIIPPPPELRQ